MKLQFVVLSIISLITQSMQAELWKTIPDDITIPNGYSCYRGDMCRDPTSKCCKISTEYGAVSWFCGDPTKDKLKIADDTEHPFKCDDSKIWLKGAFAKSQLTIGSAIISLALFQHL